MTNPQAAAKMDAGKTMAEMWNGFAGVTMQHVDLASGQYRDMKNAFYSGALCLFNWMMVQMDDDREPTEADLDKVSAMCREIHAHFARQFSQ
jgi:hypothetical protein